GITWIATLTPDADVDDSSNVITLDNTGYTDAFDNAGSGTTDSNSYAIDTQRPTATIVVADTALAIGQDTTVTITFNEAVTGLDLSHFTVANGSLSNLVTTDGGITWIATLTPDADVDDSSNVITLDNTGYTDAFDNAGSGTTDSNDYSIDTVRPKVIGISVADTSLKAGDTTAVTITFSEAVTGLDLSDFTVANGSLSNLVTTDGGITWIATLTPDADVDDSSNVITLDNTGYTDAAGNAGTGTTDSNSYAIDTQAPGVAVVLDPSSSSTTGLHYTVTFSEDVNGVDLSDFSLVSRGNASGTISGLTQIDARTYQVSITGIRGYGSLALAINGSTAGISDPAGNTFNNEVIGLPYLLDNIEGDPEFRAYPPHTRPLSTNSDSTPDLGLPPIPPAPSPSPLLPPSLFNTETLGSGIPPLGSIFVRNDPQAPSFIAQIFQGGGSSYGDGSGKGFLGFGGGDANVFGRSSLSALFDRNVPGEPDELEIHWGHKDGNGQESAGIAGAPTLGQQLQQIGESEQRQVKDLAWALGQIALQEPQA
ncbi:Ig-like domain-containing protein, partial [Pseudomonas sp. NCCP-436]|uniref:Ig-like domain-containing protein n=1 Tax=Pseudomonas sp. NCCP-436 TaxID=2842481 RepID=UPI00217FA342